MLGLPTLVRVQNSAPKMVLPNIVFPKWFSKKESPIYGTPKNVATKYGAPKIVASKSDDPKIFLTKMFHQKMVLPK